MAAYGALPAQASGVDLESTAVHPMRVGEERPSARQCIARATLASTIGLATVAVIALTNRQQLAAWPPAASAAIELSSSSPSSSYDLPEFMAQSAVVGAYCNLTLPKQTFSVSNPTKVAKFLKKFLPVTCTDDGYCEKKSGCGDYVRLALEGSNEGLVAPCFGLHLVHASKRPDGGTTVSALEKQYDKRLDSLDTYDNFLDFSLVLSAVSLDSYVEALEEAGVPHIILRWRDNSEIHTDDGGTTGRVYFSLVFHVPKSSLNFELVSAQPPSPSYLSGNDTVQRVIIDDSMIRLPHTAMSSAGAAKPGSSFLIPIAVSKAVSDISTMGTFYEDQLLADLDYTYSDTAADVEMRTYRLPQASMPIRLVQRATGTSSKSSFEVSDVESAKNAAHTASYVDETCGFDQYMDNHVALQQYKYPLDTFADIFEAAGTKWHCNKVGVGEIDIYAVDPAGDAVQLDGYLTGDGRAALRTMGCMNTSNVLFDLCSQGRCSTSSGVDDDDWSSSTHDTTADDDTIGGETTGGDDPMASSGDSSGGSPV